MLNRDLRPALGGLLIAMVFATACTDAAQADFEVCEKLYQQGKLEEALAACQKAQQKDSRSEYGSKAITLENKLHDKIDLQKRQKEAELAQQQQDETIAQAEGKVHFVLVSTPPKDPQGYSERCMARNRAYENSYKCDAKDPQAVKPGERFPFQKECQAIANSRGCTPFYENTDSQMFCCTK